MKASEEDDFYCPLCGCNLLWMPVSHIFVCEHCKESFSESAKYYLRKKEDATEGNQMKMREALVQCELFLGNVSRHGHPTLNPGDKCTACDGVDKLRGMVVQALSKPPRQCDVGTPEEQGERCLAQFEQWRRKSDGKKLITAIMAWAQTPYKAQEGGAR